MFRSVDVVWVSASPFFNDIASSAITIVPSLFFLYDYIITHCIIRIISFIYDYSAD